MRYAAVTISAALILAAPLLAQDSSKDVLAAEMAWSSGVTSANIASLDRVLAADLTYNHSSGKTDTKNSYLDKIKAGTLKYQSLEYDATPEVRIYGDAAVVNGTARVHALSEGKMNQLHLRFTHVFVREDGRWQLVAHQSTALPADTK